MCFEKQLQWFSKKYKCLQKYSFSLSSPFYTKTNTIKRLCKIHILKGWRHVSVHVSTSKAIQIAIFNFSFYISLSSFIFPYACTFQIICVTRVEKVTLTCLMLIGWFTFPNYIHNWGSTSERNVIILASNYSNTLLIPEWDVSQFT